MNRVRLMIGTHCFGTGKGASLRIPCIGEHVESGGERFLVTDVTWEASMGHSDESYYRVDLEKA